MNTEIVDTPNSDHGSLRELGQFTPKHPPKPTIIPIFMVIYSHNQLKLSDDFFRKPSKKEIKEQYSKMQQRVDSRKSTQQLSVAGLEVSKTATLAKFELAKPASIVSEPKIVTTQPKLKKYVVGEEDPRVSENLDTIPNQMAERLVINQRTLDFSNKNRFKGIRTSVHQGQAPFMMQLPVSARIPADGTLPLDVDHDESVKHAEKETGRDKSKDKLQTVPLEIQPTENIVRTPNEKSEIKTTVLQDCSICCAKPADAVCLPCGHSGLCRACAKKICVKQGYCFLCKKPVDVLLRIDPSKTVGDMVLVVASMSIKKKEDLPSFE